jgi:4-carboxymuconolactone decarboxylase
MFEPRFPLLSYDALTSEQRTIHDRLSSGPRGGVSGPFRAWLYSPKLANGLVEIGNYLRFDSRLTKRMIEHTILLVAVEWKADFVFTHHASLAIAEGLSKEVVEHIRMGRRPPYARDEDFAVHEFVRCLLKGGEIDSVTWDRSAAVLSPEAMVDLIGLTGYYVMVAMTTKATRL